MFGWITSNYGSIAVRMEQFPLRLEGYEAKLMTLWTWWLQSWILCNLYSHSPFECFDLLQFSATKLSFLTTIASISDLNCIQLYLHQQCSLGCYDLWIEIGGPLCQIFLLWHDILINHSHYFKKKVLKSNSWWDIDGPSQSLWITWFLSS
jgi:hypothetical protein